MLAPVTEAWPGEEVLLELGVGRGAGAGRRSPRSWTRPPAGRPGCAPRAPWSRPPAPATGPSWTRWPGTWPGSAAPSTGCTGRELRRLEPALGPDVRGGLSVPDDLAVDNRVLLAALRAAGERAGVRFVAEAALAVLDDGERVTGVRTDGG